MAPRPLTEPYIKALKPAPAGQRYAIADALVPGLSRPFIGSSLNNAKIVANSAGDVDRGLS
jgi:hypothetical protein